jgi:hypothetical protein
VTGWTSPQIALSGVDAQRCPWQEVCVDRSSQAADQTGGFSVAGLCRDLGGQLPASEVFQQLGESPPGGCGSLVPAGGREPGPAAQRPKAGARVGGAHHYDSACVQGAPPRFLKKLLSIYHSCSENAQLLSSDHFNMHLIRVCKWCLNVV